MLKVIKKIIRSQQFNPGILGIWLNPFYFARKELRREMVYLAPKLHGHVLDVGCGTKPYRHLFSMVENYVGMEIDTLENRNANRADIYYDGTTFPLDEAMYDGVVCNQVFEHVFNPDQFLGEIFRVLRPEGMFLLTVPFVWDEHEQPWDYARYSSFGLRHLLEKNGFVVIEQRKTNADARVIFQLINAYLYKILRTSNPALDLIICSTVMAPFNLLGIFFGKVFPANPDLYLDQVVLAKKRPL